MNKSLAELAASVQGTAAVPLPEGVGPGLAADEAWQMPRPTFAFGCHVAEVEVDAETGLVTVVDYTAGHDCGTVLNPMIVDGQIDGAVAHGLGNALYEKVAFAEDGQPLTTTFMDYRLPTALEMPESYRKVHTVTPSPDNRARPVSACCAVAAGRKASIRTRERNSRLTLVSFLPATIPGGGRLPSPCGAA